MTCGECPRSRGRHLCSYPGFPITFAVCSRFRDLSFQAGRYYHRPVPRPSGAGKRTEQRGGIPGRARQAARGGQASTGRLGEGPLYRGPLLACRCLRLSLCSPLPRSARPRPPTRIPKRRARLDAAPVPGPMIAKSSPPGAVPARWPEDPTGRPGRGVGAGPEDRRLSPRAVWPTANLEPPAGSQALRETPAGGQRRGCHPAPIAACNGE